MKYWQSWKKVMFDPSNFFKELKIKEDFKTPTIFALKTHAIFLAISYIITLILAIFLKEFLTSISIDVSTLGINNTSITIVLFVLMFISLFVIWAGLHLGALLIHLFSKIFKSKKTYIESYYIYTYASAPNLFAFIPLLNYIFMFYSIILMVIGIKQIHNLSTLKILPILIGMGLGLSLVILHTLAFF